MARPRSENKRHAILTAATQVFAERGVSAPTAKIAQVAGVAEGTLFTYFRTKDELLNQLYLELKAELREIMLSSFPRHETLKRRLRHAWQAYVQWGRENPQKRKVMAQLTLSDRVSDASKTAGMQAFAEINTLVEQSVAGGTLRELPPAFAAAILASLAETTMDFIARDPQHANRYLQAGFEAYWNAVAE